MLGDKLRISLTSKAVLYRRLYCSYYNIYPAEFQMKGSRFKVDWRIYSTLPYFRSGKLQLSKVFLVQLKFSRIKILRLKPPTLKQSLCTCTRSSTQDAIALLDSDHFSNNYFAPTRHLQICHPYDEYFRAKMQTASWLDVVCVCVASITRPLRG